MVEMPRGARRSVRVDPWSVRLPRQPRSDGDLSPYALDSLPRPGAFGCALIAGVLWYLRVGRLLAAGILSSGAWR